MYLNNSRNIRVHKTNFLLINIEGVKRCFMAVRVLYVVIQLSFMNAWTHLRDYIATCSRIKRIKNVFLGRTCREFFISNLSTGKVFCYWFLLFLKREESCGSVTIQFMIYVITKSVEAWDTRAIIHEARDIKFKMQIHGFTSSGTSWPNIHNHP